MTGRQAAMYFAWSRPDEDSAPLETLEDRFSALFEARRMNWPRLEHLADPKAFPQGIAGFLDHVLRGGFEMSIDLGRSLTGNAVRTAQRRTGVAQTPLDSAWLAGVDTLIVISWDSLRTGQQASPQEIDAIRTFLDDPDHALFLCMHHDIGEVGELPPDQRLHRQELEFHHHGDRGVPARQRYGGFALSLLAGLGLPVRNRYGLRPAKTAEGQPAPLAIERPLDRLGILEGVSTFNLHPHLPHFEPLDGGGGKFEVLARQPIDLEAPPHPFVEAGNTEIVSLLQSRPEIFPGQILVSDTTLWMSTAGGLPSLQRYWSNIYQRPRR
jgi:hypothetical protein